MSVARLTVSYRRAVGTSALRARNVSGTPRCHARRRQAEDEPARSRTPINAKLKETEMILQQMVFSMPDGLHGTLAFPEPMTLGKIEMLEKASAAMFQSLRRNALKRQAQDAGAIEYHSWGANRDAGAIEYDSWPVRSH
jgi:hypothetical protein